MKKALATTIAIASIIVLLFFTGCWDDYADASIESEKASIEAEEAFNEPVEWQTDNGEEYNCSDDGEETFSIGSDLPEGFPENIPIHSDIKITSSLKALVEGKDNYSISGVSDKSVDEIFNWYKSELSGWEISNDYTNYVKGYKVSTFTAKDGTYVITIKVKDTEDKGTVVTQSVEEK